MHGVIMKALSKFVASLKILLDTNKHSNSPDLLTFRS